MPETSFLTSSRRLFAYYKNLGERAFEQIDDADLFRQIGPQGGSIAVIVKHLSGNMLSRWTDFLTSDGEKEWRMRDREFEEDVASRADMLALWESGWACLNGALDSLTDEHLEQIVYIRNEGHTVVEAIQRHLAHYAYHVGQIVYLGRLFAGDKWQSLTIPKGASDAFNAQMFGREKQRRHFTDPQHK